MHKGLPQAHAALRRMSYLQDWYEGLDDRAVLEAVSLRLRRSRASIEDVSLIVRETHSDSSLPVDEAIDRMLRAYLDSLTADRRAPPPDRRGAQGGRRRQRRHLLLGAAAGRRRKCAALRPSSGSSTL
jgi:hypothetical protein